MKMSKDKMNIMLLVGASAMSLMIGLVAGCLKEKISKMESCCIIDEL